MSEETKISNSRNKEKKKKDLENIKEFKDEDEKEKISKPVILKAEAYKTIILYASRYANRAILKKDWKEIYGVLLGHTDDDFVYVERAEALTFGHDTDVILDERHYIFISEIQDKLEELNRNIKDKEKKQYLLGWFHSHPGLGLFFSTIDIANQFFFQTHPDGIGLVFDHTLLGKKKEEKVEGTEHKITKYDTGFEIYRITDITIDVNDTNFDTNYHNVDYIVDGLNKFFFANVLSELSALVTAGKPLQSAYGEKYELESSYSADTDTIEQNKTLNNHIPESENNVDTESLVNIPISGDMLFDVDDFFFDDQNDKIKKETRSKEAAEQLIYEGDRAFKDKDAFMGVEKYQVAIEKYKKINDYDRVLELLKILSEKCISTNHYILAEEFAEELYNISIKQDYLFYRGEANYLIGYLMLKKGEEQLLEEALKKIQKASIDYEKSGDFAGAGACYNKIGNIYQSRLNHPFNAALFYGQAIRSLNEAILRGHPLRTSLWSKPESLSKKILEIKDNTEELILRISDSDEKEKIKKDLNSIKLNF